MNVESPGSCLQSPLPAERKKPTLEQRTVAAIEVLLCSDYPTQLLLGATLAAFGLRPHSADGTLDPTFVVVLSLTDTVVLIAMVVLLLRAHGERPRDVFLGGRPAWREARAGIPMTFVVFGIAVVEYAQLSIDECLA